MDAGASLELPWALEMDEARVVAKRQLAIAMREETVQLARSTATSGAQGGRQGALALPSGHMHPTGVATAAWVFASAHSKTPFHLAGGLLAGWAVGLGAFGVMHPDFPGSTAASRLVMLTSAVLVAGAVTTAVTTAGEESATEGATAPPTGSAAPTSGLNLSADPTGKLAYDKKQATVGAGRFAVRLVNNSSLPHNVTIAKGQGSACRPRRSPVVRRPPPRTWRRASTSSPARSTRTAPGKCRAH